MDTKLLISEEVMKGVEEQLKLCLEQEDCLPFTIYFDEKIYSYIYEHPEKDQIFNKIFDYIDHQIKQRIYRYKGQNDNSNTKQKTTPIEFKTIGADKINNFQKDLRNVKNQILASKFIMRFFSKNLLDGLNKSIQTSDNQKTKGLKEENEANKNEAKSNKLLSNKLFNKFQFDIGDYKIFYFETPQSSTDDFISCCCKAGVSSQDLIDNFGLKSHEVELIYSKTQFDSLNKNIGHHKKPKKSHL